MGLTKSYNTPFGLTATNAYHRISNVRGDSDGSVRYNVEVYYDYQARVSGGRPLQILKKMVDSPFSSSLSVTHELYEILKLENQYSGAVDLFEPGTFPMMSNKYAEKFYILNTKLNDGYNVVGSALTNASMTGKCLIDGNVVFGNFYNVNASNVMIDGYGDIKRGFINDGYLDGYVVQILIGV